MRTRPLWKRLFVALVHVIVLAGVAQAQTTTTPYKPEVGQPGKDVVWVPSPQVLVDKMLDMAKVTQQDFVMDLGSGDGRTVITAAKRGVHAMGVEYNPDMIQLSRDAAKKEGVSEMATFVQADLFKTDLSKATVITMFLLPTINLQLRPTLLDLKPGTRVVSNTFNMAEWEPDEEANVGQQGCQSWCNALLWIVPAKVQGTWKMPQGNLSITQQFQKISGTLGSTPIAGKLNGDQISFTAGSTQYSGRVNGDTIVGSNWTASRVK
jgi:2-polyprenyl-3-methyl-5-hydroxy-6-metoxy-1,4-benzoquinol methylase